VPRKHLGFTPGYPAWIRTKNNASKGRCVTVTPRGNLAGRFTIFDGTAEVATGAAKHLTRADEISSALNTPKDAKIHRRKKPSGSAERRPAKRNSWSRAWAKIVGRSF
jgi:hypothetical protein